ncbi:sugar-transfer associated ATP-grasp domain-containing protein [Rhodobacter sp. SY28-1]|uniref:sugar-transfer associated ATP-grasp domain-containing protein n=1 Tax=Rhodobacter sp. SY28-1 TaxID=2562317 RepID=UPI00148520B0|nr:sugar-transfer associated ATP-grasp domain-containing protein [Rhodobacter sp. SY28-1]
MNTLFNAAKSVAKAALRRHYARNHILAAQAKLAKLEAAYGPLNATDRARCDAYAVEVLGHAKFAHWLYVFAHVAGEYRDGWIPDNFYDECVLPHNSGNYGELSNLRGLNSVLFDAPEFPDIAASVNGMYMGRDGRVIPENQLAERLFQDSDRVIFKSDSSQSGVGVTVLRREDFDAARARALGPGLYQRFIRQHELFERLGNCPAVATLRLTTAANEAGQVSLRGAYLRFGQGTGDYLQSAVEVNAVVDLQTGELGATGYLPSYLKIDRHPQSELPFAGHSVPNFRGCLDAALRCHARMPYVRCIGWDMTVDEDGGVQILEWNGGHNGIKFTEATQGPCFADLGWNKLRRPA